MSLVAIWSSFFTMTFLFSPKVKELLTRQPKAMKLGQGSHKPGKRGNLENSFEKFSKSQGVSLKFVVL